MMIERLRPNVRQYLRIAGLAVVGAAFGCACWGATRRQPPGTTAPAKESPVQNDFEIRQELLAQLEQADKALNAAYQQALGKCDETRAKKLRAAQRAWIAFRDAEGQLEGDAMRDGTWESILELSCRHEMTVRRTDELKRLQEAW